MTLSVSFGNGGDSKMYALSSDDPHYVGDALALGTGAINSESPSTGFGQVFPTTSVTVAKVAMVGSGSGGCVQVSYLPNESFVFDVVGKWSSVKNALLHADGNEHVTFRDFVQADVHLGDGGASYVQIDNAKRSNVSTGDGNDTVKLSLLTNDDGWQNQVHLSTGDGNDTITLKQGDIVAAQAKASSIVDGHLTTVIVDAGDGNDTIDFSKVNLKSADITGGAGNDTMTGSSGKDIYHYEAIAGRSNGDDHIYNFDPAHGDHIVLAGLTVEDHIAFRGNMLVGLSDDTTIRIHGYTSFDASWFSIT